MAKRKTQDDAKVDRLEVRATPRQSNLIKQAAEATGKTLTSFVLDAAYLEAQRALADRRLFRLETSAWERFVKALDRPAKELPRLRKLMDKRSILD